MVYEHSSILVIKLIYYSMTSSQSMHKPVEGAGNEQMLTPYLLLPSIYSVASAFAWPSMPQSDLSLILSCLCHHHLHVSFWDMYTYFSLM